MMTINGLIPAAFTIAELQQATKRVVGSGSAISTSGFDSLSDANELPIFLEDKYAEQLGEDPSLMVEIIEIFFSEYAGQAEELARSI